MTGPRYSDLVAAPGLRPGATPWRVADDGTIWAADGEVVCVLGNPECDLTEECVVNGALILQAPELLDLAKDAERVLSLPPKLQGAGDRFRLTAALRQVIAKAEGRP